MNINQTHRKNLIKKLKLNSLVIIPHMKTNSYYLTGIYEQQSICILIKGKSNRYNKFILFIEPKIKEKDLWSGTKKISKKEATSIYHADEIYYLEQSEEIIPKLLKNIQTIYYPMGENFDEKIIKWLKLANNTVIKQARISGEVIKYCPNVLENITPIINELRLIKSKQEIRDLKIAAKISCEGHLKIIKACKPNLHEYNLESIFADHCMQKGCRFLAYDTIVASGNNGCMLHYSENNKTLKKNELVIIDAGCKYKHYCSDITRTIPVNGKFSKEQKLIYDLVLQAQLKGLKEIKPKNTHTKVQEAVINVLVSGMIKLGILKGNRNKIIKNKNYRKFYMHNANHWIGLDTHDNCDNYKKGIPRKFEPGMVLTIEPGLYISKDEKSVAKKWRGICVRIEDMVVVTKHGNEVITNSLPKTISEIEKLMNNKE